MTTQFAVLGDIEEGVGDRASIKKVTEMVSCHAVSSYCLKLMIERRILRRLAFILTFKCVSTVVLVFFRDIHYILFCELYRLTTQLLAPPAASTISSQYSALRGRGQSFYPPGYETVLSCLKKNLFYRSFHSVNVTLLSTNLCLMLLYFYLLLFLFYYIGCLFIHIMMCVIKL